jgi:hypothetical protein
MNATNTLSKIMGLLGIEKNVNLSGDVYAKLENGDIVASDFFQVGAVLFKIDESGAKKKVSDGDYKMFTPGNQTDGPTAYIVKVKDSVIDTMDEIREDAESKLQPTLSNYKLSNIDTMDNKMTMEEVEKLQNEPLKDLSPSDKDAMKAEIEDIKKALADLKEAFASLMNEKEAEMAKQTDEGFNNEEKARKKMEEEQLYAYGKNNEGKQAKSLAEKGSQNQNLSAIKKQLFKGAPVENGPELGVQLKSQFHQTSQDRVFARLANMS